jgi:hypothetical protein
MVREQSIYTSKLPFCQVTPPKNFHAPYKNCAGTGCYSICSATLVPTSLEPAGEGIPAPRGTRHPSYGLTAWRPRWSDARAGPRKTIHNKALRARPPRASIPLEGQLAGRMGVAAGHFISLQLRRALPFPSSAPTTPATCLRQSWDAGQPKRGGEPSIS